MDVEPKTDSGQDASCGETYEREGGLALRQPVEDGSRQSAPNNWDHHDDGHMSKDFD
jgi:hypothetical protein